MEENRFEGIAKLLKDRVDSLAGSVVGKKERPFGVEKVEPIDRVYVHGKLSDTSKLQLIQKYGLEAWQAFEKDVAKIKASRGIM